MSLDALWNYLNDPRRHPTPKSTIDADNYCSKQAVARIAAHLDPPEGQE
jgi:hypothetical protein